MAGHDLIETYLHQLHGSLRWHPDVDDLVDEAADHLHETADRLIRAGTHPATAQSETLARFGDPALVAHAFARTAQGGLAMPTRFTRAAGTIGLAAAALWALAGAGGWLGGTDLLIDWTSGAYLVWANLAGLAALGTVLALTGLLVRSGGLRGWLPAVALLAGGTGAVLLVGATWAWPIGTGLLAAAGGLALWRAHAVTPAGARRDWLMLAAWPTGIAVFALLTWQRVGPVDDFGDYPIALAAGFTTGAILTALGLTGMSGWLRGEEPADAPAPLAHA